MKKLKLFAAGFLILAVIVGLIINMMSHVTVNTDTIVVKEIKNANNVLSLTGDFSNSSLDYKGFSIRFEGDKAFILIKGSSLALGQRDGSFQFAINTKEHGDVTEVYLEDSSHTRKIWPTS